MKTSPEATTLVSTIVGLVVTLALIICVTILLINHIIDISQVGPFLTVLAVPLAALAGLPIFHAALQAPSPGQATQVDQQMNTLGQLAQQVVQQAQAPSSPLVVVHTTSPADVQQSGVQLQSAQASVPSVFTPPAVSETIPPPQVSWTPPVVPMATMTSSNNPQIAPPVQPVPTAQPAPFQPTPAQQFVPTGGQWPALDRHFQTMSDMQVVQPPQASTQP